MNAMGAMDSMGAMSPMGEMTLLEWPLLVCVITVFGTAAFALMVAPAGNPHGDEMGRRVTRLARWLAAVALMLSPLAFVNVAAEMAGVSMTAAIPLLSEVIHQTHAGRVWAWRMGAAAALLAIAWLPGGTRRRLGGLCLAAATLLLFNALDSHAIDKGALAVTFYFVHELAAGLWLGALAGLCLGFVARPLPMEWFSRAVPRVSRLAGWCVAVLVVAGCFNAYQALGWDLDHLLYAAYGRTLIAKLATAAIVLAIGGYNRYWLVPRAAEPDSLRALMRNVAVESVLLLAVLGWSVCLANTPPPH